MKVGAETGATRVIFLRILGFPLINGCFLQPTVDQLSSVIQMSHSITVTQFLDSLLEFLLSLFLVFSCVLPSAGLFSFEGISLRI